MTALVFMTARELAAAIQRRQLSAVEVVAAHLAQIERHNPTLNAIVTLDAEGALRRAREADAALARGERWGPLHGVPFTAKDSIETAGMRTTSGFPPLADYVPGSDAPVVARMRAAGAILLGKTNLPPMCGDVQTDNPIFGRTNNPWNQRRTPGGSTGGGAAAVAAGMSPLELGSDYGASVRVPAHFCGIYAIKPTDRRIPDTGHIPELPGAPQGVRHMAQIGPLARSVGDLTLALGLLAGPDGHDWEVPPVPLVSAPERALRGYSLAWTDDFGVPVMAETRLALAQLAGALQALGTPIERAFPTAFDLTVAWETWAELSQAEIGSTQSPEVETASARYSAALDSELPFARGTARAKHATMRQYTATLMRRDGLISALEQFFERYDALLCPVSVGPAFAHRPTGSPIEVDHGAVSYWMGVLAYTSPFNLTGHPSVVLPLARSAEGLPIGLQLVGRRWGEMELLAIAERLAEVIGPWQGPPGV